MDLLIYSSKKFCQDPVFNKYGNLSGILVITKNIWANRWDSKFSFDFDLLCDIMVRLKYQRVSTFSHKPHASVGLFFTKQIKFKRKMSYPFGKPEYFWKYIIIKLKKFGMKLQSDTTKFTKKWWLIQWWLNTKKPMVIYLWQA